MKRFLILLTLFTVITSSTVQLKRLEPIELVPILVDIHLLEALTGWQVETKDEQQAYFREHIQEIFEKYNTTAQAFDESLQYYARENIAYLELIYMKVIEGIRDSKKSLNEL